MVIPNNLRLAFRIISACVAGIFLFQQVAWAGDLIETTLDRQTQAQAQTFAPSYLQSQQLRQEFLIGQKQGIEEFINNQILSAPSETTPREEILALKGPMSTDGAPALDAAIMMAGELSSEGSGGDPKSDSILSITTQAGDIIHYKDGAIDYIEKKNEGGAYTIIKRIAGLDFVDGSNELLNAEITYPDNTIEEVRDGLVKTITRPDGTIYHYDAGERISYILYTDGGITIYTYGVDAEGNDETALADYLIGSYNIDEDGAVTLLSAPEKTVRYDNSGKLKEVVFKTGKTIQYDSGMITYLKDDNLVEYFFEDITEADGLIKKGLSKIVNNGEAVYVAFDDKGNLVITSDEDSELRGTYDNSTGSLISVDDHGTIITQLDIDQQNELVVDTQNELCAIRNANVAVWGEFFDKLSAREYAADVFRNVEKYRETLQGLIGFIGCVLLHVIAYINLQLAEEDLELARTNLDNALELERPIKDRADAILFELIAMLGVFNKFPALLSDYRRADGSVPYLDLESVKQSLPFLKVQYQPDGTISEILNPNGEVIKYTDGLPTDVISGADTMLSFRTTGFGNVSEITIDRYGIKRIYDQYGNLKTLSLEDAAQATYADGSVSALSQSGDIDVNFGENGDISSITEKGGAQYLYEDKRLSAIIDSEGVTFTLYDDNRIKHASYPDSREYDYSYDIDVEDGKEIVIVYEAQSKNYRYYKDDLIYYQITDLGLESFYTYIEYKGKMELCRLVQRKGEKVVNQYTYSYPPADAEENIVITDEINGERRIYNSQNKIVEYDDSKGNVYKFQHNEEGGLVSELTELRKEDGTVVYYSEGAVDRVACPNGVIMKNIEFDSNNKLKRFTLLLTGGEIRTCEVFGDWITISTADDSKLIYKEDVLVAVNSNKKLFRFQNDEIISDITMDIEAEPEKIEFNTMSSEFQWRDPEVETWPNYFPYSNPLSYHASVSPTHQREVYVDLAYKTESTEPTVFYYDLKNKKVSFYVKLQAGSLPAGKELLVSVFAKSQDWTAEYGTEVTITKDNQWYKIDLVISDDAPLFGSKQSGFNPEQIRLIGIRLMNPYNDSTTFDGDVYVMDANYSTLPESDYIEAPFLVEEASVTPYVDILLNENDPNGNPNYRIWDSIPAKEKPEVAGTTAIDLNKGSWRYQMADCTQGITDITRNDSQGYWELTADLNSSSQNNHDGEVFIDLRYDIPDYEYKGPLNLVGKTLTFKVKAPQGFIGDINHQSWVQVYVKDEEYDYQYGCYTNITNAGEWYEVMLTPQYGEIAGGETAKDFDPTRIVNIGVKFSCGDGSNIDFNGNLYLINATPSSIFDSIPSARFVDMNTLSRYAYNNDYVLGFEKELRPQVALAKEHLPNYFKDDRWTMKAEYSPQGKIVWALKGDRRIEHYDEKSRLVEITDPDWGKVAAYTYNDEGELIDINYDGVRLKTRESIAKAELEIEIKTSQALYDLGKAEIGAIQSVHDTIDPEIAKCDSALQQLRAQLDALNKWKPFWRSERNLRNDYRNVVEHAIADVERAKRDFLAAAAQAYVDINDNCRDSEAAIRTEYESSMAMVLERKANAEVEILKDEVIQLLSYYYMKVLGRNPDQGEINAWLDIAQSQGCLNPGNRVVFDVVSLKETLSENAEYQERKDFNEEVKNNVLKFLNDYVNASDEAERSSMLSQLGLTPEDIAALNKASWGEKDIEVIGKWLTDAEMSFGRCASETVYKFLQDAGINLGPDIDLKAVARDLMLIDIICGAIDSMTEGSLKISLYAMNKYINKQYEDYGKEDEVYNAKLVFEDLVRIVGEGNDVIVHLSNDHFVTVTDIDAEGKVTYFETTNGINGESVTIDNIHFRMQWTGYAISERAPPANHISDKLALTIKGSFDPITAIIIILALVSTVLSFIDNEICQLVSKILGIAAIALSVFSILANFDTILTTFYKGIQNTGEVVRATTDIGIKTIVSGFNGFASNFANLALQGLANTFTAVCYNIAFTQGLSFLNINADIARITVSFLTGGFLCPDNFLAGALIASMRTGISIIGREVGLDPFITDLLSTTACSMGAAFFDGGLPSLEASLKTTILPNFASELAYIGITKAGELLGVDPRISYLSGSLIRSYINPGVDQYGNPNDTWTSVMNGLLSGVANVSLQWAGEALDLDPTIANLGFSAIAGAINAGLIATIGENPQHKTVFELFFDTYKNNALTMLGYGNPSDPSYLWMETAYKATILDFSNIVRDKGLIEALNIYGTSFFNSTAVGAIAQSGLTIGRYFDDKLKAGQFTIYTTDEGKQYADVTIINIANGQTVGDGLFEMVTNPDGSSFYKLVGKGEYYSDHYFLGFGELGKDSYGNVGFWNDAMLMDTYNTFKNIQRIDNGDLIYAETKDLPGNYLIEINPLDFSDRIQWNAYGEFVEAKMQDYITNKKYLFENSELNGYYEYDPLTFEDMVSLDLSDPAVINLILGSDMTAEQFNSLNLTTVDKLNILNFYVGTNGINNKNPLGSPAYMSGLMQQLAWADPSMVDSVCIPLYKGDGTWAQVPTNSYQWFDDVYLFSDEITYSIVQGIYDHYHNILPSDIVGFAYSGGGDPLLQALNLRHEIDMKSVVLLGTPLKAGRIITNPNVENVIMIQGDKDAIGDIYHYFGSSPNPINEFHIVLEGYEHTEYLYDPANTTPKSLQATQFIAKVMAYSKDADALISFLNRTEGVTYDSSRKMYNVDFEKLVYHE